MRNTIIKCGGEVHFQTKMIRLILESEGKLTAPDAAAGDRVIGVEAVNLATGAEETYRGPVILATGHSARDVYRYLASAKIDIDVYKRQAVMLPKLPLGTQMTSLSARPFSFMRAYALK